MKVTFNKYWIIIAFVIILNVLVFNFLSSRLERYVATIEVDKQIGN